MNGPRAWYAIQAEVVQHFGELRPAQQRGLAWWVYGTLAAESGCESAVVSALHDLTGEPSETIRARLREWLADGTAKAAPCQTQVEVRRCFAPLLRWLLGWWRGDALPIALDATAHGTTAVALVISVLYRDTALPIAWHMLPGNRKGAWMPALLALLGEVAPVIPRGVRVVAMADRGLWSPRLWQTLRACGWRPLLRVQGHSFLTPLGRDRCQAQHLVPQPGAIWLGPGTVFSGSHRRQGTLVVVWAPGEADPWVLLSDLPPEQLGPSWYALRFWIEAGFRVLKRMGWHWQRCRRTDPTRLARHWLVLAVTQLWSVAVGTRLEEADRLAIPPGRLRTPPQPPPAPLARALSLVARGRRVLWRLLDHARPWRRLWLLPEPWPQPPPDWPITRHPGTIRAA
jgi:hypothetical protein